MNVYPVIINHCRYQLLSESMVTTGGESAFWKPEIPYTGGAKKTELPVIAFGFAVGFRDDIRKYMKGLLNTNKYTRMVWWPRKEIDIFDDFSRMVKGCDIECDLVMRTTCFWLSTRSQSGWRGL